MTKTTYSQSIPSHDTVTLLAVTYTYVFAMDPFRPGFLGTVPVLRTLKTSAPVYSEILFGRQVSRGFPSHKSKLFPTVRRKILTSPQQEKTSLEVRQPLTGL
jgi:hypothetical protein